MLRSLVGSEMCIRDRSSTAVVQIDDGVAQPTPNDDDPTNEVDYTSTTTTSADHEGLCACVRSLCFRLLIWQHQKIWVKLPPYLQYRLRTDAWIIRTYILHIAFVVFVMAYFQTVWARTTAFYRHRQITDYTTDPSSVFEHRLKDVGHEIVPDYSDSDTVHIINELIQQLTAAWLVSFAFIPYFFDTFIYFCKGGRYRQFNPFDYSPSFTFAIVIRFLMCLSVVECLRIPSYLATSIPGPATHCIGAEETANRPTNYGDAFYKPQTGTNCGDLVFSGHIVLVTLAANFAVFYFPKIIGPGVGQVLSILPWIAVLCQVVLVLATRSHYSVDLVVGFIVANMAWRLDLYVYRTKEPIAPFSPAPEYISYFDPNKDKLQERVSTGTIDSLMMELNSLDTLASTFPTSAILAKAAFSSGCPFESSSAATELDEDGIPLSSPNNTHSRVNSVSHLGAFSRHASFDSAAESVKSGGSGGGGSMGGIHQHPAIKGTTTTTTVRDLSRCRSSGNMSGSFPLPSGANPSEMSASEARLFGSPTTTTTANINNTATNNNNTAAVTTTTTTTTPKNNTNPAMMMGSRTSSSEVSTHDVIIFSRSAPNPSNDATTTTAPPSMVGNDRAHDVIISTTTAAMTPPPFVDNAAVYAPNTTTSIPSSTPSPTTTQMTMAPLATSPDNVVVESTSSTSE
eukprot:TRINITY_DN4437_c0_g1_i7.p1 TRINITY_DN4437_c0_g1~~TRINITY_DN4437_c0_g1_i7.p1  ORF type:complete len:682 (+),score=172.01 TRINITY_DN4437_c0_g1_i7:137-2182(+)